MPQKPYAVRLVRAVGFWLVRAPAGRKALAALVAAGAVWGFVGGDAIPEREPATYEGTWSGLENHIAPRSGPIVIEGAPGQDATCTARGKVGYVTGDQWVFRGEATLEETSCKGRIAKNGDVATALDVKMEWHGRIKGQGGDWEDVDGQAECAGDLKGSLKKGGKWKAKCKNEKREWEATFDWEPS